MHVFIRQADVVGRLKLYCCTFLQPTILSSGAEDAHHIYTRGSVLGEALKGQGVKGQGHSETQLEQKFAKF